MTKGVKIAWFCLSCYLLETLYLLGFKETSIRQKFNTQHHLSKMPLLQKALKKYQAFEEFFSSPEILLFCFECRRQRNNTAQSLEWPLNLQSHCSQQLCSPRVLMEVQWPQQRQIAFRRKRTEPTEFLYKPCHHNWRVTQTLLMLLKHTFPLLPKLFANNLDLTDVLSDQYSQLLKSERLFKGFLWILYFSSVSSYHDTLICSKPLYAWLYTTLILGVSDRYVFFSAVISWQITTINFGCLSNT